MKIVMTHNIPLTNSGPQHTHTLQNKYLTISHNTLIQEYKRTKKVKYKLKVILTGASWNEELKSYI